MLQRRVVTDVAFCVGMGIAPLPGGLAEECDIEHVRFAGIDQRRLLFCDSRRNERVPDGIGVDAVVDLGQGALEIPTELEPVVLFIMSRWNSLMR